MANYETLKSAIQQVVKTNGNNEITGALLQQSLLAIINSLGAGYQFMGVATPTTNPGTIDQKAFYIANGKDTYTNFGGISITEDEVVILYYDTAWHKLLTGIASQEKLSELESELIGRIKFSLTEDKYIKVDGSIDNYIGWAVSNYIPCSKLKTVIIRNDGVWSKYNHFYDANKRPIGTNFSVEGETIIDIIDGASYFALSNTLESMMNTTILVSDSIAEQTYGNKKEIALLNNRVNGMSEKTTIQIVNNAKASKSFPESLSIGAVAELQDFSYVMTSEALTNNAVGVWVCCKTVDGCLGAIVVDKENMVIAKFPLAPNEKETMLYISLPQESYKIYWTETYNDNLSSIIYYDYDISQHKIYGGELLPCLIDGKHYNDTYATENNEISIKFDKRIARSCGIYIKVNSKEESNKIDKIRMHLYNQGMQIGSVSTMDATLVNCNEWAFVKMMPSSGNHNTQYVDEIRISVILKDEFSKGVVKMQFKDNVVINKFDRPILVINFDDVWDGSEISGAYDYLLDNNIPFSITGKFQDNTSLSESMNEKLVNAYKCGLLDVGLYGNESGGVVVGDSTTYQELIRRIEQSIEIKRSHGFDCVSFGSGNHYTSNAMVRALSSCGFKAIRLGAPQGMCVVESMLDNGLFMSPTYNNNYACIGGMGGYFTHGVFVTPPSGMHDTYSNFIDVVSYALEEYTKGGLWILNMKQYCEMKNAES